MERHRPGLALHLWFIAFGSLAIVATQSGPGAWFVDAWAATCAAATGAALIVNHLDRRARRRWMASLVACSPAPVA
jgi:hypothetical protein